MSGSPRSPDSAVLSVSFSEDSNSQFSVTTDCISSINVFIGKCKGRIKWKTIRLVPCNRFFLIPKLQKVQTNWLMSTFDLLINRKYKLDFSHQCLNRFSWIFRMFFQLKEICSRSLHWKFVGPKFLKLAVVFFSTRCSCSLFSVTIGFHQCLNRKTWNCRRVYF